MCDFSYMLIFLPLFSKPAWALLKAALLWKENPMDGVWWDDGCVLSRCLTLEARVDVLVVVVRSTSETAALSTQVFREVMKTILSECSRKRSGEERRQESEETGRKRDTATMKSIVTQLGKHNGKLRRSDTEWNPL